MIRLLKKKDLDKSIFVCIFSNHYEKMNIKDKTNFYNNRYSKDDKIYNDVIEFSCKDSSIDGEYYILWQKKILEIYFI